ncbi:MAG: NnrU family protein [Pseudomonadota bacterium]
MLVLVWGLIAFLGAHGAMIGLARKRKALIDGGQEIYWKAPVAVGSIVGLGLIIWGYGLAREETVFLYQLPSWVSHISALLMLFALIFFVMSGARGKIAKAVKHPQLLAVKIWATAHLLANGDTASILLFGSFLAWAVAARISAKKRVQAGLLSDNPGGPVWKDILAIVIGLALYVLFVVWAHEFLFGVPPIQT